MDRTAEEGCHHTSNDFQRRSSETKPCGLLGEGEIHLAMKPAMAPTMMAQMYFRCFQARPPSP